jgi:hypothetical protein
LLLPKVGFRKSAGLLEVFRFGTRAGIERDNRLPLVIRRREGHASRKDQKQAEPHSTAVIVV